MEKENSRKLLTVLLVSILVILLLISAFWIYNFIMFGNGNEQVAKQGPIFETEEFTVNTLESTHHYVKAQFAFEMTNNKAKAELEKKEYILEDTVIMVLSGQSLDVMSTIEGKNELKTSLKKEINKFMDKGEIVTIYFKTMIFN